MMQLQLQGRAWVFGDNIDTDQLAPGHAMRKPLEQLAKHCLEAIAPDFASSVQVGDVLVAGEGFGVGSSREQAVEVLIHLGIRAVLAKSVARIFYRNALNLGLPVVRFADAEHISNLDRLQIDLAAGRVHDLTSEAHFVHEPIPPFLLEMLCDGGLLPHLHKRLQKTRPSA